MTVLNRIGLIALLLASLILLGATGVEARPLNPDGINVLFLMSRNFGVNYFLDCDRFEEYGWSITHATLPAPTFGYRTTKGKNSK